MIVEPAHEELVWRETKQVGDLLAFIEKTDELRVIL
jgi:hypothetical protein